MDHIQALNAYERSKVYSPLNTLSPASRALYYKRKEAKAGDDLEEMGSVGRLLWPDHWEATWEEYNYSRKHRSDVIAAYRRGREGR